ncbi:MAG: FxsA family protein [Gammaproteobacteria bacterium]
MPVFFVLLVLLIGVPLIELYCLIQVGRVIGAGTTVALVVLTAVLGAWLLRLQGLITLARARATLDQGELPAQELVEGLILLLTGVLLLTPGFLTDAIGFAALVPAIRRALARTLAARLIVRAVQTRGPPGSGPGPDGPQAGHRPRTIDAEYQVEREDD